MATWGGSTVDNLESITEDGVIQDNDEDEEDDDGTYCITVDLQISWRLLKKIVSFKITMKTMMSILVSNSRVESLKLA